MWALRYTSSMPSQSSETSYRAPQRKPGHKSLEKLLLAAEDQLRQEELDLFTVDKVLERAGLSVGAFYARFPGKTALLHAVQDRLHARVETAIHAALGELEPAELTLEEAVDKGFGILVEKVLGERQLQRAFMMLSAFDAEMRAKGEQINRDRRRALSAVLAPHRGEIGHDDPDAALGLAYAMYLSMLGGRLVPFGPSSELRFGVSDEAVFDQLKQAITTFLRGTGRGQTP
jgi:AcrR family transcriptional regulator